MNIKNIALITGIVLSFMGTVCNVVVKGVDDFSKIKALKGGK